MIYICFVKVKKNVGKQLMQVPENEINNFFHYHWYLSQVQDVSMEWDSLIIVPQVKMIINIEVKSGSGFNALKKAAKQTNAHQGIFKKIFGAHLSPKWKFVKAAFTPNLYLKIDDSKPCEYCNQFMIRDIQKICGWIQNCITYPHNIFKDEDYKAEYDNLLVGIIGYSSLRQSGSLNKKILGPHEFIQATKSKVIASDTFHDVTNKKYVGEDDNIRKTEYLCYMLTPDQLMAVKDPSPHIIIEGDHGSGKTYVLKERTKQCAQKYPEEKIAYINLTINSYRSKFNDVTVMDMIADNNFKDYNNVDVVTATDLQDHLNKHKDELIDGNYLYMYFGEDCSLVLKHFLKCSNYHLIFIDEMPPLKKDITKNDFFSLEKMYCITMKCDNSDNRNNEWIIQMEERYKAKRIMLKHNMRNSKTIVNLAFFFSDYYNKNRASVPPSNNIPGPVCYHYHNTHELDEDMLARAAILKYFKNKPNEPVLVLTNTNNFKTKKLYNKLFAHFSKDKNVAYLPRVKYQTDYEKYIREVKGYLEKPDGILVTDIDTFHGAQALNIILIIEDDIYVRNMIMRTLSFAIIRKTYSINQFQDL